MSGLGFHLRSWTSPPGGGSGRGCRKKPHGTQVTTQGIVASFSCALENRPNDQETSLHTPSDLGCGLVPTKSPPFLVGRGQACVGRCRTQRRRGKGATRKGLTLKPPPPRGCRISYFTTFQGPDRLNRKRAYSDPLGGEGRGSGRSKLTFLIWYTFFCTRRD